MKSHRYFKLLKTNGILSKEKKKKTIKLNDSWAL